MMKRAVLFDFDLTLADSTRGATECVDYALTKMDLPRADNEAIRSAIGLSLPVTLARLTGLTDPASANAFVKNFVECPDLRMVELTSVFPDAGYLIHELRKHDVKAAIVSTKYRYRIDAILARSGLTGSFDTIVGGEDVILHKPDPEGLERALRCIGISSQDAVYVGDHPVDAMAASAARIPFIATLTGFAMRSDFGPWPDTVFVESLSNLVPVFHSRWGTQTRETERRPQCPRPSSLSNSI